MSNSVDFAAVSIDPGKISINKGEKTFIQVSMQNNGPDVLPAGEGTCQITLNNKLLSLPVNRGFKNLSGEVWKLVAVKRTQGTVNLFFKTIADFPIGTADFQFNVTGKAYGTADITLASSLSATATSSDPNGTNQSVSTQLIISKS